MKWTGISSFTTERALRHLRRRGFSLTELAIVLGVGAIIIGGIWEIAAQSQESSRQQTLKTDIAVVVKNVRAYYGGTNGIPQAGTGGSFNVLTPFLAGLSPPAFPGDMLRLAGTGGCTTVPACVDHPWGPTTAQTGKTGSFGVCAWNLSVTPPACMNGVGAQQFFSVELQGVSLASCIKAIMINSGSDSQPGLYDVSINGTSIVTGVGVTHQLPPLLTDVEKLCTASSTIDFVYRLTTPQS